MSLLCAGVWACGPTNSLNQPLSSPGCPAGTAMIGVGDGFQAPLCGCQEPAGVVVTTGSGPMTCTVAVGTQMMITYIAPTQRHQIVPASGTTFPASPVYVPPAKLEGKFHAFVLPQAGTYGYVDAYDSGITGSFVAR